MANFKDPKDSVFIACLLNFYIVFKSNLKLFIFIFFSTFKGLSRSNERF